MFRKTMLPALALATLALAGCGGGASSAPSSSAPAVGAPASSATAPSTTADAPSESASASPSASTAAAEVKDPCDELDAGQVGDLTGVKVKKGTTQAVGASKVCTWLPQDGTKREAAVFSAQEGPIQGQLSQIEDQLKEQFKGKVSSVDVSGADEARYVTGKKSGLNVIDVIAVKDEVFYQIVVATPRDAASHKDGAVKVAETLLKG